MTEGARKQGQGLSGTSIRTLAWLAWSVCALSLIFTVLGLVVFALNRSYPGAPVFDSAFRSAVIVASCATVGVLIVSRRPAHPIGWLFSALGLFIGAVLLYVGPESLGMWWIKHLGFALWVVGFVGLPVAIGIAILRYRLYEIDVIINRTLVFGALTVVTAGTFQAIDAAPHYLLVTLAYIHTLPGSIIAALVVAALFRPLRHRIQRFVDRYLPSEKGGVPRDPRDANPRRSRQATQEGRPRARRPDLPSGTARSPAAP